MITTNFPPQGGVLPKEQGGTGNTEGKATSAAKIDKNGNTFEVNTVGFQNKTAMMFDSYFKISEQEKPVRLIYGVYKDTYCPYTYNSISDENDEIFTHRFKPTINDVTGLKEKLDEIDAKLAELQK